MNCLAAVACFSMLVEYFRRDDVLSPFTFPLFICKVEFHIQCNGIDQARLLQLTEKLHYKRNIQVSFLIAPTSFSPFYLPMSVGNNSTGNIFVINMNNPTRLINVILSNPNEKESSSNLSSSSFPDVPISIPPN